MSTSLFVTLAALAIGVGDVDAAPSTCMLVGDFQVERLVSAAATPPVERVELTAPSTDCLIQVGRLPEGALLVDVRPAVQTRDLWVEGVVEQPLLARITAAAPFAGRHLVIFGNGQDDNRLLAACDDLRTRTGGPVHVVRGGIRSLAAAGHPVSGDLHALRALDALDPESLHWLLVRGGVAVRDLVGLSDSQRQSFGDALNWLDPDESAGDLVEVVMMAAGGRPRRVPAGNAPPLVYDQGPEAYERFVAELDLRTTDRYRTGALRCAG